MIQQKLKAVKEFKYLGYILASTNNKWTEVQQQTVQPTKPILHY